MPFIRLSDSYIDHPKFRALSDGAFRLWHEAMAFCRKHQTDGIIPMNSLRTFHAYSPKRARDLTLPWCEGANPLWVVIPGTGYNVHDYLFWNLSKEEESDDSAAATARMRRLRARRKAEKEAACSGGTSGGTFAEHRGERSPFVPDLSLLERASSERGSGGKGSGERSGEQDDAVRVFIEETYPTIYAKVRNGATYRVNQARDFDVCRELVETYGSRLAAMLELFLRLPPAKDVLNQPGTPRQFKFMAPMLDAELRKHGR